MRILQNNEVVEQATTFMRATLLEQPIDKPKEKLLCEMSE
jgi:hypothetical protein